MRLPVESWIAPLIAAGVAGAVLLLLHRLRVSPPRRIVATTLFWKQAVREEHRRVLWGRISRWKSFALLLLILFLLSLVLSGVRSPAKDRATSVAMVVDCGGSMGVIDPDGTSRLSKAIDRARGDLARLGQKAFVLTAGATPRLLNQRNDPPAVTDAALKSLTADPDMPASTDALEMALSILNENGRVLWYTDRTRTPVELPESARARIEIQQVGQTVTNAGIVNVIFKPVSALSSSGELHVRLGSWGADLSGASLQLSIASRQPVTARPAVGSDEVVFREIAADGEEATLVLTPGDALSADNVVKIRLPRRRAIDFEYGEDVPASLRMSTGVIGASRAPGSGLSIRVTNTPVDRNLPSIQVASGNRKVQRGGDVAAADSRFRFESAVCGEGADLRDIAPGARPLLYSGDAVLAAMDGNRLWVSEALFSEGSTCVQRPAFLAMLAECCQTLAGWTQTPQSLPLARVQADPLWSAGASTSIFASDSTSDLRVSDSTAPTSAKISAAGLQYELWQVILLVALLLILVETILHLKGKVV